MSPPISRIWMSFSPRWQSHRQQQRCRHRPWSQPHTTARSFDQRARQSRVRGQTIRTLRMQVLQVREPLLLPLCMAASGRRPGDSVESLPTRSLHPWEKCRAVPGSPRSTAPLPSGQLIGRARRCTVQSACLLFHITLMWRALSRSYRIVTICHVHVNNPVRQDARPQAYETSPWKRAARSLSTQHRMCSIKCGLTRGMYGIATLYRVCERGCVAPRGCA